MDNNFILILTAFFTAGSLGFINYFILERLSVLTFRKSTEQDKKHFLLFFSFLNYMIYLLVFLFLRSIFVDSEELFIIASSIVITLFLTILISIIALPYISTSFNELLNWLRSRNNLSKIEHNSPRSMTFDNKSFQSIFIFTLNKQLISSGYLNAYSNESDYYEIILVPFDEPPFLNSYEKVKAYSESEEGKEKDIKILLDFEKNLQYFVITDLN